MNEKTILSVSGMKCMGCVANARKSLEGMAGLQSLDITLDPPRATLTGPVDVADAIRRLTDAGYPASPGEE